MKYGLSSNKAWHVDSVTEVVMGNIVCRTLTEVGKECWPHQDPGDDEHEGWPVTDKAGLWVRVGDRQHRCGTLTEFGLTRTEDDAQRERSSWSAKE